MTSQWTDHSTDRVTDRSTDSYERTNVLTKKGLLGDNLSPDVIARVHPEMAPARVRESLAACIDALEVAATRHPHRRPARDVRAPLTPWFRRAILTRDRFLCAWCGSLYRSWGEPLQIDHVVPWSAGGSDASDNLRTLCRYCNGDRSNLRTDTTWSHPSLIVPDCSTVVVTGGVAVWCVACRRTTRVDPDHAAAVRRQQADHHLPYFDAAVRGA